jgi:hypothetical protein
VLRSSAIQPVLQGTIPARQLNLFWYRRGRPVA